MGAPIQSPSRVIGWVSQDGQWRQDVDQSAWEMLLDAGWRKVASSGPDALVASGQQPLTKTQFEKLQDRARTGGYDLLYDESSDVTTVVWSRPSDTVEALLGGSRARIIIEADADLAYNLNGDVLHIEDGRPFMWFHYGDRVDQAIGTAEEQGSSEVGVIPGHRFVYAKVDGLTHEELAVKLQEAGGVKLQWKDTAASGRIWLKDAAIAMWEPSHPFSPEEVDDLRTAFDDVSPSGSIMEFRLQFSDDVAPYTGTRTLRRHLEGYDTGSESEEAAEQSELNHQAHLLGARAAGRPDVAAGSSVAAAAAGDAPVAKWRAQRSEESLAMSVVEALLPIPAAYSGYMGGATGAGPLIVEPVENVIETDHSELGVRQDRFRWARGAPDTVFWTDHSPEAEIREQVAQAVEKKTGASIRRHRFYPDGWQTWRDRVEAAADAERSKSRAA